MTKGQTLSFFTLATQRSVVIRALRIAAIVGVVLALINHGNRLVTFTVDLETAIKIAITFLVPFCVSTYSSVLAIRERRQTLAPDDS